MSTPKVFISYSHLDEKKWKNRLQKHLEASAIRDSLSFWEDRQIAVGSEWRAEIKTALESAQAAILLISVNFLGSNFIRDEEVPVIMQRRIKDGMKAFPLIVGSCSWKKEEWLSRLQVRPTDGKPLALFRGDDVDRILSEFVSEIDALLNQPQPKPPTATETQSSMAAPPYDECPYLGLEAFTEDKFLMWRRHLASRTKAWEQKGRDNEWLLYGGERDEARHWLNERGAELTAAEIGFITWDDRPDFQIELILSKSPGLLLFSGFAPRKSWFTTLVFCHEVEKALSIAREIEATEGRAEVLRSIAEALIKAGLTTEPREVATEALGIALKIEDKRSRAYVLGAIAKTMGKVGMAPEAGKVATEALSAAREIEDANVRPYVLSFIAEPLVKAGMAAEALAAARESENKYSRAYVLSAFAEALVKSGMATEAREAMTEALAAVREIDVADSRAQDLISISVKLAKTGMVVETLATVREVIGEDSRAQVLSSLAVALVKAGMASEARKVATEALAAAHEIESAEYRERVLSSITKALVKAGMAAEALATAREIKTAFFRAEALYSIAIALAKAGMAAEALAAAREIDTAYSRALALSSIAKALAKAGMSSEGHETASEAVVAAREIEAAEDRARALMAVADCWLGRREADETRTLLEETQSAASKVFDDEERSDMMGRLAVILARLHSYRAARETAEQCSSSSYRLAAYTAILREYHIERDPSLAQLFAEEKEEEEDD